VLHAGTQLGDVGAGVGQERHLVHPGYSRHGNTEVAEASVELVLALWLGLGEGKGSAAPPPRCSSFRCWWVPV
jgi:hypothetical protein